MALVTSELPADYAEHLSTSGPLSIRDNNGSLWEIPDRAGTQKLVEVDELTGPYSSQLALHIESIEEFFEESSLEQSGRGKPNVSFERLRKSIVVADNGESLIYLDPDDGFSAYAYYHDGTYVEKMAGSFGAWLAGLQKGQT